MSSGNYTTRRLPVYLLLDVSGSMKGEAIAAVQQGISLLVSDLKNDPQAIETAWLSVIVYSSDARVLTPLTELMHFIPPPLEASGFTNLGQGLKLAKESIDREVRTNTPTQKGDWKPLIFLMTDGRPTDDWAAPAEALRNSKVNIIACAAGPDAKDDVLKQITEVVLRLSDCSSGTMNAFFKWVSQSIRATSASVGMKGDAPVSLAKPPADQGITIVP